MKVSAREFKNLEKIAVVYKAISHPMRLAILENFNSNGNKNLTVKSIYEKLGIEQPVASHHLGILKRAGLLNRHINEGMTFYGIKHEHPLISEILSSIRKPMNSNGQKNSLRKK
jgi:ArsR family transcriptional regulator, virulence genes transcriptional regulator